MPKEDVIALIKKAISDEAFKISLNRDFEKTIESHNLVLTKEEFEALQKTNWLEKLPTDPDLTTAATWIHIYKSSPGMTDKIKISGGIE